VSLLADSERLATRIGAGVLVAIAGAVAFVLLLADRVELTSQLRFAVHFAHAGPLASGAPVMIAGQRIGEVESVQLLERGAPGPLDGEPGAAARIAIDADRAYMIDAAGEFFVASRGPLSERYLEIGPPTTPTRPIRDGDAVRGIDPPSMDRVIQRTWDNLMVTRRFVEAVKPELDALTASLRQLGDTVSGAQQMPDDLVRLSLAASVLIDEARSTWNDVLGGRAGLDRIAALIDAAGALADHADRQLAALGARWQALDAELDRLRARLGGDNTTARLVAAIDTARAAMDKIDPLRAKIAALRDRFARGEGSIGKLMTDPEFPEDAKELGRILKRQPWKIIGHPQDGADGRSAVP
jgi:ABC-type transporter Mla subunit MlaD